MNIIETKDLSFQFGKQPVVQHLDLHVPPHSIYGFLGPNGAGKSTTIKLILGLLRPRSGSVRVFGEDLKNNKLSILSRVGNLIETPTLYQHLTAYDNLQYMNILFKKGKNRIDEILELVGLEHARHKKVKHFSMGMKQRLGIGMALFHDPDLVILDEPVNGLDPSGIQEMRALFLRLKNMGKTVFISSHLLAEIEKTCTHIGIIQQGKLLYEGPIDGLVKTTTRMVQLKVEPLDKAIAIAKDKKMEFTIEKDVLHLSVPSDHHFNELIHAFVRNDIRIFDFERESASLEELFIGLTKEAPNPIVAA